MHPIRRGWSVAQKLAALFIAYGMTSGISLALPDDNSREQLRDIPQSLLRPVTVFELKLGDVPSDMTVTIVKKGTSPPEIHVERGQERYHSPEGNLASFPSKVRVHVERMLGVPPQHSSKQQ